MITSNYHNRQIQYIPIKCLDNKITQHYPKLSPQNYNLVWNNVPQDMSHTVRECTLGCALSENSD